jgi:hypothetical protein
MSDASKDGLAVTTQAERRPRVRAQPAAPCSTPSLRRARAKREWLATGQDFQLRPR